MGALLNLFTLDGILSILYSLPAIVISLSLHEFAHAYAAYKQGDHTAKACGRLTLDPLAHVDWIGFLSLLLLGFGWAKPVPVNPSRMRHGRLSERLVCLAGIFANLLLANLFLIIYCLLVFVAQIDTTSVILNFVWPFVWINIVLAVFNLIPIPPLDGYRFVISFVNTYKNPRIPFFLEQYGHYVLLALMLLGVTDVIIDLIGGSLLNLLFSAYKTVFTLF